MCNRHKASLSHAPTYVRISGHQRSPCVPASFIRGVCAAYKIQTHTNTNKHALQHSQLLAGHICRYSTYIPYKRNNSPMYARPSLICSWVSSVFLSYCSRCMMASNSDTWVCVCVCVCVCVVVCVCVRARAFLHVYLCSPSITVNIITVMPT